LCEGCSDSIEIPFVAKKKAESRKKRTREHVIADQSLNFIQYFIINAGFTSESTTRDYEYDLTVNTFDSRGLIEPGNIYIQLKASETLVQHADGRSYVFDLDIRDYNLWIEEPMPVFLVLYEATSRKAFWLYFQQYIAGPKTPRPRANARTIRVRVPKANRVKTDFVRHARNRKAEILKQLGEFIKHG